MSKLEKKQKIILIVLAVIVFAVGTHFYNYIENKNFLMQEETLEVNNENYSSNENVNSDEENR